MNDIKIPPRILSEGSDVLSEGSPTAVYGQICSADIGGVIACQEERSVCNVRGFALGRRDPEDGAESCVAIHIGHTHRSTYLGFDAAGSDDVATDVFFFIHICGVLLIALRAALEAQ